MTQHILKLTKVFLCCALLAAPAFSRAQQVITLQKAVELALERNLTIKQAKVTEALGAEDVRQAKGNQTPAFTVNPQGSYNFGRSLNTTNYNYTNQAQLLVTAQASVSVTIFQGGQL